MSTRVTLLGGPFDGRRVDLTSTPPRILIGTSTLYEAVTDPDTGVFLGCYVHASRRRRPS